MNRRTLILLLILGIFSAGLQGQKKQIITSASMLADMVDNIVGDLADVEYIVPRGQDPHLYKPTPSDVIMVQKADLIFINGLTFEGWVAKLIANSGTKAETHTITDGIEAISSDKYSNSYDPHAWMDVSLAQTYIFNIRNALMQLMPEHSEQLQVNFEKYAAELKELDEYILGEVSKIPETQRVLITSHDAFAYFGRRYGLRLEAIVGISTEAEVQSSDIMRVHRVIKESEVPAIFIESTINPKIIQQIAKDNKISIGGELYADSLGEKGGEAGTYVKMLRHNIETIVKGLTGEKSDIEADETVSSGKPLLLYGALFLGFALILFFVIRRLNNL